MTVTGPECLGLCCLTETVLFLVASCQSVQEFTCCLSLSSVSLSELCLCVFSRHGQPIPLFLPVSPMFFKVLLVFSKHFHDLLCNIVIFEQIIIN